MLRNPTISRFCLHFVAMERRRDGVAALRSRNCANNRERAGAPQEFSRASRATIASPMQ